MVYSSAHEAGHPIQPVYVDADGVYRFKHNALVRDLWKHAQWSFAQGIPTRLSALTETPKTFAQRADWQQLAQLTGYSMQEYGQLPYVDEAAYQMAEAWVRNTEEGKDLRIAQLEAELRSLREALRGPMAKLFGVLPKSLEGM